MKYKVSVIIPIYGVEKFIGRCAEKLMQQTLKEVEYIFVNDATPDHSMEVLQEVLARYPERQDSMVITVHETNKGLPAARNTGLQMALHIPADTRSAFPVISVQSPVSIQCCWQS